MKLDNMSVLITGGTGSFGKGFIKTVLKRYQPKKIIGPIMCAMGRASLALSGTILGCEVGPAGGNLQERVQPGECP